MPLVSPEFAVEDIGKAMDYYERVLGFQKGAAVPGEGGKLIHGDVRIGDSIHLMLSPAQGVSGAANAAVARKLTQGGAKGAGVLLYIDLGDVDIDRYYEDVTGKGAKVIVPIQDQFWGDRNFTIEDLEGYILTFSQHVRDVDLSQMQRPQ